MTTEESFLLRVLADYLNRRKTENIPDGLDWDTLADLALRHQVSGMVYYQCKELLPADKRAPLKQAYFFAVMVHTNRTQNMAEIGGAFEKADIPFFTVKGLDVAALYPTPALRTMGDCDIIVHPEDKERAHQVLLSLGFTPGGERQDMEWHYHKNGLDFELHDHLLYDETVNSQVSKDFTGLAWDYAKGEGCRKELDRGFHFIFLLLHLKKHLLNSGVGFRQFMDLVVAARGWQMDAASLETRLQQLQLQDFRKVCFALCNQWFDAQLQPAAGLMPEFIEQATEKIFANGIFGFNDASNRANGNLNTLHEKGKLRTVIGRIFPSYRGVYYVPHYSFVRGRPWLLPAVWVYRWFRGIFKGKGKDAVRLLSSAVQSDEQLEDRQKTLSQWGLW